MVNYCVGLLLLTIVVADIRLGAAQNECSKSRYCRRNGPPIRFPFRLKHRHPDYCGYPGFSVSCTPTNDTALDLSIPIKFFVRSIDYKSQSIQVYEPNHCHQKLLLYISNQSIPPFQLTNWLSYDYSLLSCTSSVGLRDGTQISCLGDSRHLIYLIYSSKDINDPTYISCTKMHDLPGFPSEMWYEEDDVQLGWSKPKCGACEAKGDRCKFKNNNTRHETVCLGKGVSIKAVVAGGTLGSSVLILAIIALICHVYRKDKNDRENQLRIEKFLEDYGAFKPSRYSYADIKKITDQFKDKLGEGAYGTVFKGKLSNDILVAVKILNNSKGNGEEFVNEVRTMGRIHHVNVVRLVGFCADGCRRALVYEFLPKDSLQKYIPSADPAGKKYSLNWKTMHDITLGIAKGIEYLHQGCDQRILHFDIKPHNVLLDHNFTPKISDFGLAKLCSKDESLVSMTTARGTLGYIAPEVFSRNFGKVSYKSDVYSFGMLLLEMVGGRKNVDETTENADQVYYPEWIYNLLEDGDDLRIHIDDEGDARIAKKLAIVGLWCIQWHPGDRPSMQAVVQMLEGGNKLTMPPNPFASTGTKRMNVNMPARNMKQDLEIIPE